MRWLAVSLAIAVYLSLSCSPRHPNLYVESSLEAEIRQLPAIDNHAHPAALPVGGQQDHDYDALPPDAIQDLAMPAPFRPENPLFAEAWQILFGYRAPESGVAQEKELQRDKQKLIREEGDAYPAWVLNRADTSIMLANRVVMGRGLTSDRFKWVPFVDMFLFPLNNAAIREKDPEHKAFIGNEERLLIGYLRSAQMTSLPATFDDYLTFVSHMLESWKSSGAVALKFELAYLRDLDISAPTRESTALVYSSNLHGSQPSTEDYKTVQDYVFRHIAREASRLRLPVHIHTSIGAGSYFRSANANPLVLEPLFNDPSLRKTNFVMLHGSWPFAREAATLILKPNVYVDTSAFMYMTYPAQAAKAIRLYLEAAPEKVLYGSDASPFSDTVGWEETAWIGSRTGRLALGLALTAMVRDEEITLARAKQIAHLVLHDNAHQLYGF